MEKRQLNGKSKMENPSINKSILFLKLILQFFINFFKFLLSRALIRGNLLIIPNVQVEDEGEYTCVATNHLASIKAKAYLLVYGSYILSFTRVKKIVN